MKHPKSNIKVDDKLICIYNRTDDLIHYVKLANIYTVSYLDLDSYPRWLKLNGIDWWWDIIDFIKINGTPSDKLIAFILTKNLKFLN